MKPEPHPRPKCWRCQDWREVISRDGKPKPCPECQTKKSTTARTALSIKGTHMKIRIAAVSATMFVALLGAAGPAAAATTASYGTADQHAAVTKLAAGTDDDPAAPGSGTAPAPAGPQPQQQAPAPQVQQPGTQQVPTQNVQTQAGGGAIAVGSVAVLLLLGTVCFFLVKRGGLKAAHLALGVCMGVLLAGTFIGPLVQQVTGSAVTSFGSILGGL